MSVICEMISLFSVKIDNKEILFGDSRERIEQALGTIVKTVILTAS